MMALIWYIVFEQKFEFSAIVPSSRIHIIVGISRISLRTDFKNFNWQSMLISEFQFQRILMNFMARVPCLQRMFDNLQNYLGFFYLGLEILWIMYQKFCDLERNSKAKMVKFLRHIRSHFHQKCKQFNLLCVFHSYFNDKFNLVISSKKNWLQSCSRIFSKWSFY